MEVRYFAWFQSKHEKTEFINMLKSCSSDIERTTKIVEKYPNVSMFQAQALVENFKKSINQ